MEVERLPEWLTPHALKTVPETDAISLPTPDRSAIVDGPELIREIQDAHQMAAAIEVPWFLANMPEDYFNQVDACMQKHHLRAIIALKSQRISMPELMLCSDDNERYTFISSGSSDMETLQKQLGALPEHAGLERALLFNSRDQRLSINIYDVVPPSSSLPMLANSSVHGGSARLPRNASKNGGMGSRSRNSSQTGLDDPCRRFNVGELSSDAEKATMRELLKYCEAPSPLKKKHHTSTPMSAGNDEPEVVAVSEDEVKTFLSRCSSKYAVGQMPRLLYRQLLLCRKVFGSSNVAVEVETAEEGSDWATSQLNGTLLTVALPGVSLRSSLRRMLRLVDLHDLEPHRVQVDTVSDPTGDDGDDGFITLLRMVVRHVDGVPPMAPADWMARVKRDAVRLKWVSDRALFFADGLRDDPHSLLLSEVAIALSDLSLSVLDHPLLSRPAVQERMLRPEVAEHAATTARLLVQRFAPVGTLDEMAFLEGLDAVVATVERRINDEESRMLLRAIVSAARHTRRTNLHLSERWALTLRLDPAFFAPALPAPPLPNISNQPYGVFFCAGRHFNAFHVRFTDIARGGLRVVLPPTTDAYNAESRRHFQECFGLAWAQQLKNKDLPEGGSKAVCLVHPVPHIGRERLIHDSIKKCTDGFLDLITPDAAHLVSREPAYDGELLYLGPDENIAPDDINWIAKRAALRGYALPSAFISSKPKAGINHKEYGVTSEGVAVFLREGLRAIGIDTATQSFTIKLTGGPDGDVAGNMLKILHRDYGERARVVGLADGFGCAEDPDGLPMAELMRLVERSLPTSALDPRLLGPHGVLHLASTPEGAEARNSMHNRVVSDAFVPAGGRPNTINGANWRQFLTPDGSPSSRVIVEGANLFLTAEARAKLFETCKLPIIKDSSANKCGVICSSMEIVASMVLSEERFVQLKPLYVPQVLARLRELARLEASMLFREFAKDGGASSLPSYSERISFAILRVGRALDAALDKLDDAAQSGLWACVRDQLMPALVEHAEAVADPLEQRLPWPYQKACISSGLSSRLVYREGLHFVEALPEAQLASFAFRYLQEERRVRSLAAQVASSGLGFSAEVEALLLRGGVRTAAEMSDA